LHEGDNNGPNSSHWLSVRSVGYGTRDHRSSPRTS
jgi:hypothetical protein